MNLLILKYIKYRSLLNTSKYKVYKVWTCFICTPLSLFSGCSVSSGNLLSTPGTPALELMEISVVLDLSHLEH